MIALINFEFLMLMALIAGGIWAVKVLKGCEKKPLKSSIDESEYPDCHNQSIEVAAKSTIQNTHSEEPVIPMSKSDRFIILSHPNRRWENNDSDVREMFRCGETFAHFEYLYCTYVKHEICYAAIKPLEVIERWVETCKDIEDLERIRSLVWEGTLSRMSCFSERWIKLACTSKDLKGLGYCYGSLLESVKEVKWKEFTLAEAENAKTVTEIREVIANRPGSDLDDMLVEKWNKLSLQEGEKAMTIPEIMQVLRNSPENSEAHRTLIAKWEVAAKSAVEQAQSKDELKKIQTPEGGESRRIQREKWKEYCQEELEKAVTFEELKRLYYEAKRIKELEPSILRKWVDSTQTAQEIETVWQYASNQELRQKLTQKRMGLLIGK